MERPTRSQRSRRYCILHSSFRVFFCVIGALAACVYSFLALVGDTKIQTTGFLLRVQAGKKAANQVIYKVFSAVEAIAETSPPNTTSTGLPVTILVISLPRRTDRRADMERLRRAMGLDWTYLDATEGDDEQLRAIPQHVSQIRSSTSMAFSWPEDINDLANSPNLLPPYGYDMWTSGLLDGNGSAMNSAPSLPCATNDSDVPVATARLPQYRLLTLPRIACWHSHLGAIRSIANTTHTSPGESFGVILEDDIDVERDIYGQLQGLWPLLPAKWDIIFLGECWMNC
ncbi:hypothetical protein HGRIS_014772 [Hohenbuehelia grisea]|uniref:Glycosyltransferase family 25 protein n=1 Tax=Hohenbuehelia grisea TaxID=104357 RepID=A0ABR3IQP0_9AGAR